MGQAPPTAFPLTRMAPPGHRGLASVVSCAPGMTGRLVLSCILVCNMLVACFDPEGGKRRRRDGQK